MAETEKAPAETADWMKALVGEGLDTDMTGDRRPGGGANARFWMPKGTERVIVFLTEGNQAPVIWEHQVKLGGSWRNWFTCLEPMGQPCPLCQWADSHNGQYGRYKAAFFTVIDTNAFKDKAGVERKNLKKLLAAKKDTAEILKRKFLNRMEASEGKSGLKLAAYKVYRTNSDKSAAVGEDFEFVKMADMSVFEDASELNYSEILHPDVDGMRRVVGVLKATGGEGGVAPSREPSESTKDSVSY